MNTLPDTTSLKEVKQHLHDNWEAGIECPACTQFVKLYKKSLSTSMVIMLINLYKLTKKTGEEYQHIIEIKKGYENVISATGDFATCRFWGLTEEGKGNSDKLKRQGFWKLTQKGIDFVENKRTIPSHIRVFNAKCYGLIGSEVTVGQALRNKFNYYELMAI